MGTIRLFSISSCKLYPRAPSTSESKWRDYINRKQNSGDGSEKILNTKFGGVRLDSMNVEKNEEAMTVGSLTNITEPNENTEFYFENESPSKSILYQDYKVSKIEQKETLKNTENKEEIRPTK